MVATATIPPKAASAPRHPSVAMSHAFTDVTAFMYLHASALFFEPFGTTQALPLKYVIGPPLWFVKNLATRSAFGELFENVL